MRASVVVPTRNRARLLHRTLDSLANQTVPAADFEIVVVDNGSVDATPEVLAGWAKVRPGLRCVVEPTAGVSRARNAGLAAATAPIVAFVDDDVVAAPGWLAAALGAWDRWPHAGVVCGRADLWLDAPAPRWFGPEVAEWYSRMDFGPHARILDAPTEVPWGLNLAIRTDVVRGLGGFAEHLGRVGGNLRGGEDAVLVASVRASGALVAYEPAATVHHVVTADRLRVRWLLHRAWDGGLDGRAVLESRGSVGRTGVTASLGRVAFRGWREATRRVQRADSIREAALAESCHRIAGVASAWAEWTADRHR